MDIIVGAKNFQLTPALREYTEQKIKKLEHLWQAIIVVHLELESRLLKSVGSVFEVRARVIIPGPDIEVAAEAQDMYQAIDQILIKLKRQVTKVHGKFISKRTAKQ